MHELLSKNPELEIDLVLKTFDCTDWANKKTLPTTTGIYLFIKGREILYVGSSINLQTRMKTHDLARRIQDNNFKIYWRECVGIEYARSLESRYIRVLKPVHNKTKYVAASTLDIARERKATELKATKVKNDDIAFVQAYENDKLDDWFKSNTWSPFVVSEMQKDPELLQMMYKACKKGEC